MIPLVILSIIIIAALILFVSGWISVDLTGLLVLSALTLTGLVSANEALAGFSSPAVITVIGMFILSAGLTRTGVANRIGYPLQLLAKRSEIVLIIALMASASILSALINTTTVAAIMLPTTMDLARRSGRPPARLLMPLALGCLLGGPFTGISTPPNILATEALATAGLTPFKIFDFTPITGIIVVSGILFVVLIGRYILPNPDGKKKADDKGNLESSYQLNTHIFTTQIRKGSKLAGRSLSESRLGSALFLTVVGIQRQKELILAPSSDEILQEGDTLIVHGHTDHTRIFTGNQQLRVEIDPRATDLVRERQMAAEIILSENSSLIGKTLVQTGLRKEYQIHMLTLHDAAGVQIKNPQQRRFAPGDRLLLEGEKASIDRMVANTVVKSFAFVNPEEIGELAGEQGHLLSIRIPRGSALAGRNLIESRLGNAFGLTVLGIFRKDALLFLPPAEKTIQENDLLILQGAPRDLEVLEGLQELVIKTPSAGLATELESQQVGATEILLSPRTTLDGKTVADLRFRDHYGLNVLAVWRRGTAHRTQLQNMPLQFGDALLVYGQRKKLAAVARDTDFLVLDKEAAQAPLLKKAPFSTIIMITVLLSAILGYVHISIAALTGAALMVLTGCLTMEDAYRSVEWKVIFLIASMLPLGVAVQNTGAAQLVAESLIRMVGDMGPRWVVAVLFLVTVTGTQVIPTAALVVLMSPIALNTATALAISPQLLMMTIAMAASASYASPLSHPAHLLVMGPGGYKFMDYVKIGVPLTVVVMAVSVWVLPIFWPA
ncbi:anion permease [Desulfosarcina sp. OttesenSCG-928-A07]|nr:anion permease [Desulfosarcina sp. OttesenSCG-928-A07]